MLATASIAAMVDPTRTTMGAKAIAPPVDPERHRSASSRDLRRRIRIGIIIAAAILVGFVGRAFVSDSAADNPLLNWLPWLNRENITVYFGDPETGHLVPVSRTVAHDADPSELIDSLLSGPDEATGLVDLMPEGMSLLSAELAGSRLSVSLAGQPEDFDEAAVRDALRWSLSSWPGVDEVSIDVAGVPLAPASRHLVFFYDEARDMMVARPSSGEGPREIVYEFLAGPADPRLIGLPADVELLTYEYSAGNGLLYLDFTYLPSVRELAVDHPDAMRRVLESLLATLTTGFPDIQAAWLDFEGHEALGLGQCADLLRTAQTRPEVLNDERLLERFAST